MKKRASQVTKRKWSLNALKSPIQGISNDHCLLACPRFLTMLKNQTIVKFCYLSTWASDNPLGVLM